MVLIEVVPDIEWLSRYTIATGSDGAHYPYRYMIRMDEDNIYVIFIGTRITLDILETSWEGEVFHMIPREVLSGKTVHRVCYLFTGPGRVLKNYTSAMVQAWVNIFILGRT